MRKENQMFYILATKPLNDGTSGFRFNVFGKKGLVRKRKAVSRGFKITGKGCTKQIHMGKLSVYIEQKKNVGRRFYHFAG
jgi:hypothetical protein